MLLTYSLYTPYILLIYSLYAPYILLIYLLYIPYIPLIYYSLYTAYILPVYPLYTSYIVLVYPLYTQVLRLIDQKDTAGWRLVKEEDGITVYRQFTGSKYACVKCEGVLNVSPDKILSMFEDHTRTKEYNALFAGGLDKENIAENTKVRYRRGTLGVPCM